MSRQWNFGVAAMAMAFTVLASNAWAQRGAERPDVDPAALAEKCIERVSSMAERCSDRTAAVAENCLAAIDAALDQGAIEDAEGTAARCTRHINRSSHECVAAIRSTCHQCVRRLTRMDETELADQVKSACEQAVALVMQSRDDAVAAIEGALPPV